VHTLHAQCRQTPSAPQKKTPKHTLIFFLVWYHLVLTMLNPFLGSALPQFLSVFGATPRFWRFPPLRWAQTCAWHPVPVHDPLKQPGPATNGPKTGPCLRGRPGPGKWANFGAQAPPESLFGPSNPRYSHF